MFQKIAARVVFRLISKRIQVKQSKNSLIAIPTTEHGNLTSSL
jgi:hypothetical protein